MNAYSLDVSTPMAIVLSTRAYHLTSHHDSDLKAEASAEQFKLDHGDGLSSCSQSITDMKSPYERG